MPNRPLAGWLLFVGLAAAVTAAAHLTDEKTEPPHALTAAQEADARRIASTDPHIVGLLAPHRPTIARVGPVHAETGEIVGAVVELELPNEVDIEGKEWIAQECFPGGGQMTSVGLRERHYLLRMDAFDVRSVAVTIDLLDGEVINESPTSQRLPGGPRPSIAIPPGVTWPDESDCPSRGD